MSSVHGLSSWLKWLVCMLCALNPLYGKEKQKIYIQFFSSGFEPVTPWFIILSLTIVLKGHLSCPFKDMGKCWSSVCFPNLPKIKCSKQAVVMCFLLWSVYVYCWHINKYIRSCLILNTRRSNEVYVVEEELQKYIYKTTCDPGLEVRTYAFHCIGIHILDEYITFWQKRRKN